MKSTLDSILALVSKPGYKTSEGQLTGLLISGAIGTGIAAINKWFENKASDAPAFLIAIVLLIILFACKWYGEHRTSIKGELGRLLNNPDIVEIITILENQIRDQAQAQAQAQIKTGIPGALTIAEAMATTPPKPARLEILRNGESEIQTFDTRLEACQAADALRAEDPTLKVYVL